MTTKERYKLYLKSPEWKELRQKALDYADGRCQLCNTPNKLNVHHRFYPKELGTEPVNDLTVLCDKCHYGFHNNFTLKNKQNKATDKKPPKTQSERRDNLKEKRRARRLRKRAKKRERIAENVTTRGIYSPESATVGGGQTNREYRLIKRAERCG